MKNSTRGARYFNAATMVRHDVYDRLTGSWSQSLLCLLPIFDPVWSFKILWIFYIACPAKLKYLLVKNHIFVFQKEIVNIFMKLILIICTLLVLSELNAQEPINLQWATHLGGPQYDHCSGMVYGNNSIYSCGYFIG